MLTLLLGGDVYAPRHLGRADLLLVDGRIGRVGAVDRRACEALDIGLEIIDASGCLVMPGLIDPHEHLLGGSGEDGFSTQTPELTLAEIVSGGITTVVGCLREILDRERFAIIPAWLYATHVQRSAQLLEEAIELPRLGAAVDMDVAAHDLQQWLGCYREADAPLDRLTISSDARRLRGPVRCSSRSAPACWSTTSRSRRGGAATRHGQYGADPQAAPAGRRAPSGFLPKPNGPFT